jgi:hypothetical protein
MGAGARGAESGGSMGRGWWACIGLRVSLVCTRIDMTVLSGSKEGTVVIHWSRESSVCFWHCRVSGTEPVIGAEPVVVLTA